MFAPSRQEEVVARLNTEKRLRQVDDGKGLEVRITVRVRVRC